MRKDTHLVNIYLKIHNKKTLTIDDLRYLAQYAPDCFEKTCQNVVYNIPETKPLMETTAFPEKETNEKTKLLPQISERGRIEGVLANLKNLEADNVCIANVDVNEVKNLLGNLYMEMLFPHNDRDTFFDVSKEEGTSMFDARI